MNFSSYECAPCSVPFTPTPPPRKPPPQRQPRLPAGKGANLAAIGPLVPLDIRQSLLSSTKYKSVQCKWTKRGERCQHRDCVYWHHPDEYRSPLDASLVGCILRYVNEEYRKALPTLVVSDPQFTNKRHLQLVHAGVHNSLIYHW